MSSLFRHQFYIATKEDSLTCKTHFRTYYLGAYCVAVTPDLPVIKLLSADTTVSGYILGWSMRDGQLLEKDMQLPVEAESSAEELESWLYTLSGRWIAIICLADIQRVYMDTLASHSLVYHPELRRLASTPGLIDAKLQPLFTATQLIERDYWYPAGCTAYQGVSRLLANHYLDLATFESIRHWPLSNSNLEVAGNWVDNIPVLATLMRQQFGACATRMPVRIGLTAGLESRVMLACSKDIQPAPLYWTRSDKSASKYQDIKTASVLAHRFALQHVTLPFTSEFNCDDADIEQFLLNTGYCVGGSPLKSHKLIDSAGPCFAFSGIGGEVARDFYNAAKVGSALSARNLLQLTGLPELPQLVVAIERYLDNLPKLEPQQQLALFYLENRVSAFGAVHRYAYQSGIVLLSPFSHRAIVHCMLTVPLAAQIDAQFHKALIKACWPALLALPFNEPLDLKDKLHLLYQRVNRRLFN